MPEMNGRAWTAHDLARLQRLIEDGFSYGDIAKRLGRTKVSINKKAVRQGYTPKVLSTAQVAALFGYGCTYVVIHWIDRGWLPAVRQARIWSIKRAAVYQFLQDQRTWIAWRPEQLTDSAMRRWATEMRKNDPRWLSTSEVATRLGRQSKRVLDLVASGALPATRYGVGRGVWFVRETDLEQFLITYVRRKSAS